MLLSIIIPVYNNWHFTKSLLNDLLQLPANHEIIVVDNGSTDKTHLDIQSFVKTDRVQHLRFEDRLGFARACNEGYKVIDDDSEYILFLNNDVRVQTDHITWTQKLIDEASDKNSLVGPTSGLLDDNLNFIKEIDGRVVEGNSYISGWCLLAHREVWDKLILPEYDGPFTEEFETYFEDSDCSFRAKELDIKLKIVPVPAKHIGKRTTSKLGVLSLYTPAKQKFIKKWKERLKKF